MAFTAVLNETIKPYLASKGHSERDVTGMHLAWTRSLQLQIALWAKSYMNLAKVSNEW